eukprot:2288088-Rhodomonas_salina.3
MRLYPDTDTDHIERTKMEFLRDPARFVESLEEDGWRVCPYGGGRGPRPGEPRYIFMCTVWTARR